MLFSSRLSHFSEDASELHKSSTQDTLSSPSLAESDMLEGRIKAWCTVLGVFLAQFSGYANAFGVYQSFYSQHYLATESASAISWIGSFATLLISAIGLVCGPLFDKGYFYHMFISGAILQSLSIFMLSSVRPGNYYQVFLSQGVMCGIGQGLTYVPSFAVLSHHFRRRRTTVMSIVASAVPLGGVVHTVMLNKLLNDGTGFEKGVRISGAYVTGLLFLSCLLVRTGYNTVLQEANPVNAWTTTKKCFTEIPSLLTILGFTLFQLAYMYPYFYFQLDSLQHGLGTSVAFYSLVIINAASFVGRFTAGFLLPFISIVDQAILTTVVCGILIIGMIWLGSVASVVTLGILYGIFSGINIAMMAPMLGLTSSPAELGVRMGVGFAATGLGDLIGSPICGALLTGRYIWWMPAVFCGATSFASGLLFAGVRILSIRAAKTGDRTGGKDVEVAASNSEGKGVTA